MWQIVVPFKQHMQNRYPEGGPIAVYVPGKQKHTENFMCYKSNKSRRGQWEWYRAFTALPLVACFLPGMFTPPLSAWGKGL